MPTECQSGSWSKLFAKVISIRQKSHLARKTLCIADYPEESASGVDCFRTDKVTELLYYSCRRLMIIGPDKLQSFSVNL